MRHVIAALAVLMTLTAASLAQVNNDDEMQCPISESGVKNLYWGDVHVHTAYSLDAWGYGTLNTPREAYEFAKGNTIELQDGSPVRLERALDFVAVTDHAEWFDLMYVCTDPQWRDDPYCKILTTKNTSVSGGEVFREYVLPTITRSQPETTPICAADPEYCARASLNQWSRIQQQANEANEPCQFTALIGFEWSATPDYSHTHRNIVFANENVTGEALDYLRYPVLGDMWEQLSRQCQAQNGCDAIAIPHNTNMGDGMSFDVETEDQAQLAMRARYERLIEIHQEKGNSECLPAFGADANDDCDFELYLTHHSKPRARNDFSETDWEKMRSSYARGLLLRGLAASRRSVDPVPINPLQLGLIASTDNHAATPGNVDEDQWKGSIFGLGDLDRAMTRLAWNPGGLVAVWAEENTRESVFAAMKRREVYGTSGTRIRLRFVASTEGETLSCSDANAGNRADVVMGGEFQSALGTPDFLVMAHYDKALLGRIEIIKGEWKNGKLTEKRIGIWSNEQGSKNVCQVWRDPDFDKTAPAFWYPRVLEVPGPRWSTVQCRKFGRCDDYPQAVKTQSERAWGSPIWYLPPAS